MVDKLLLNGEIAKNGYTQQKLAKELDMAESTFIRKVKTNTFTMNDADKIIEILHIENPMPIFFAHK